MTRNLLIAGGVAQPGLRRCEQRLRLGRARGLGTGLLLQLVVEHDEPRARLRLQPELHPPAPRGLLRLDI